MVGGRPLNLRAARPVDETSLKEHRSLEDRIQLTKRLIMLAALLELTSLLEEESGGVLQTVEKAAKPERDVFARSLKLSHAAVKGRKFLFEFDPAADYEVAVAQFLGEAAANGERGVVFTRKGSTLYNALDRGNISELFCLSAQVSLPTQVNGEMHLPSSNLSLILKAITTLEESEESISLNIIFDNLSDLVLLTDFEKTYNLTRQTLEVLSPKRTTAMFLLNPVAHSDAQNAAFRGLFQNILYYGKDGLQIRKLPKQRNRKTE